MSEDEHKHIKPIEVTFHNAKLMKAIRIFNTIVNDADTWNFGVSLERNKIYFRTETDWQNYLKAIPHDPIDFNKIKV